MPSILSAIAHAALHESAPFEVSEARAAGQVLLALSTTEPAEVLQHLTAAQSHGASMSQIGSLALYQDRPAVAQVLAEHFGLRPEDYRTLGDEFGSDALENYPTLAFAAFLGLDHLQHRALAWGANPNARWKVSTRMGNYQRHAETISWVTENIRRLNGDVVDSLLAVAVPVVDRHEQSRRLLSLADAGSRFSRDYLHALAAMVDRFSPRGPHALTISPWDVAHGNVSLAVSRTVVTTHRGAYDEMGKALAIFNPWIEATVPSRGTPHLDCLRACIAASGDSGSFTLPAWCVARLSVPQAQSLLVEAWTHLMPLWSSKFSSPDSHWTVSDTWLSGRVQPLLPIAEIATRSPMAFPAWGPRFFLGQMSTHYQLSTLPEKALDDFLGNLPVFPGQADPAAQVTEVRALVQSADQVRARLAEARRNATSGSSGVNSAIKREQEALLPDFKTLHTRLALETVAARSAPQTPAAAPKPKM